MMIQMAEKLYNIKKSKKSIEYRILESVEKDKCGQVRDTYVEARKIDNHYVLLYGEKGGICDETVFGVEEINNLPKVESRLKRQVTKIINQMCKPYSENY